MLVYNLIDWLWKIQLVGIDWKNIFDLTFDPFYMTISNTTILPFILFFVLLGFMYYIKKISEERQGILLPYLLFSVSYWFLGALCWVLAAYYYLTGKKIKWGPNYFST
jgi:hypothetical protein